jgi:hypothetical protein
MSVLSEHKREHNAMLRRQGRLPAIAAPRPWTQHDIVRKDEVTAVRTRLKASGWEVRAVSLGYGTRIDKRRP